MFERTRTNLRDWGERIDERLMGITPQTNETLSRRELSRMLAGPATRTVIESEAAVGFGLELVEINRVD